MRKRFLIRGVKLALFASVLTVLLLAVAGPASAATLNVCPSGCPFSQIAPAIAAAHPGDTVRVAAGTYVGGFTVDIDLKLVGAGAAATVISGGGPVITIGQLFASSEPTVSIDGVTITGGVTHSSVQSNGFFGIEGVWASGGGVEIPPNADFTGGANVTISNSVITANRAAPTTAIDSGLPCPPDITITCIDGDLPFALAAGGGIDNWGTLTLVGSTVSNNLVGTAADPGSVASDANGGAIMNWLAGLTISNSKLDGNHVSATAPNGRFADGGAILLEGGSLRVSNGSVMNNSAVLDTGQPNDIPDGFLAIAGGIHAGGGVSAATITNTTVSGNSASMTNSVGDSTAFSGGLHTDGVMTLSNDVIANNSIFSRSTNGNGQGDSGAGELAGTITNTQFTGNSVTVVSDTGDVNVSAGAAIFTGTLTKSVVSNNHISGTGANIILAGGGLQTGGPMTLRNTIVSGNSGSANGSSGTAQGGGIFAVDESPNGPPGGPLILTNSSVTGNVLSGSSTITLQGGGIFVTNPLTLTNSTISGNVPDNCFGSSC